MRPRILLVLLALCGACGDIEPGGAADAALPDTAARPGEGAAAVDLGAADSSPGKQDGGVTPTVQFERAASSAPEGSGQASVALVLSAPSAAPVSVTVEVSSSQARDHDRCTPRDYELAQPKLTFAPGETRRELQLTLFDDALAEGDEQISLDLKTPQNAAPGARNSHVFTIVDDDRQILVSVADHGARADGKTDDREAIQQAIDAAAKAGGGVVLFPPGDYLIGDPVILKPGITYFGYGARTLRLPNQGKWENTFRQEKYASAQDSAPLVVQGFTLDGNSQNQGPYQGFELQQAHLLNLMGNYGVWGQAGRVKVYVEDVTLQNGTGDGVQIVSNVDARLCHVVARDVFRGGMTMTGGNSIAHVYDLTTSGKTDPTGIDIEVEGSDTVQVYMEKVTLLDGDFDVAMSRNGTAQGGVFEAKQLVSLGSAIHMHTKQAKVRISDSELWVGAYHAPTGNTVMQGQDVIFTNVSFHVTEGYRAHGELGPLPEQDRTLYALDALWNSNFEATQTGQRVVCDRCSFHVDSTTVEPGDKVYVMHTRWNVASQDNRLILKNPVIDPRFDGTKSPECVTCEVK